MEKEVSRKIAKERQNLLLSGSETDNTSTRGKNIEKLIAESSRLTDWRSCQSNSHSSLLVMEVVSVGVVPSLDSALYKAES